MHHMVPNHVGHTILVVSLPVIVHVLYDREEDRAIIGDAFADKDNLFHSLPDQKARVSFCVRFHLE